MIVINGEITIDPSARAELVAAAVAMQRASQAEPGCNRYVFTSDLEREDLFHVSENWEDRESLDAHLVSSHMATFSAAIAGKVKGAVLKKYEASGDGAFP